MARASRTAFFFFNDTATTEIYTLSLHDALPICHFLIQRHRKGNRPALGCRPLPLPVIARSIPARCWTIEDRKSTRLNSSHSQISYAVFCLKKKNGPRERVSCKVGRVYSNFPLYR